MTKIILFCFCVLFCASVFAQNINDKKISIDLHDVSLADALHHIAKQTHDNIIINPAIHVQVTLHLHNVSALKTMNVLLRSHDLVKVSLGDAWYITPRSEWMQHEQDTIKFKTDMETTLPLETRLFQLHYAKAEDVSHLLQENANSLLSKRGHVRSDVRTNMICVQDIPDRLYQIQQLIKKIDVPVQQVLIETKLANVDSNVERDIGVDFSNIQNNSNSSTSRYGLLVAKLADGGLLDVQLSALENQGKAELISNPRLFTASQQTAVIESGEEIPYQEESSSGGTTVVFKKAVLSLKVTPQILPDNKVLLQLQVNQDKPSKLLIHGIPAINTRQLSTNLLLKDGQTVVLGGIYESDTEHLTQSIPWLAKIPLLGLLLQHNEFKINKRELLIFVTPRIVPS